MTGASSAKCIAWITVMITESVAIITVNTLAVIVFLRNRSLRKRSMYLVINLAVADMLAGGFTEGMDLVEIGDLQCSVWKSNVPYSGIWNYIISSLFYLFPIASLTNLAAISLERMHATFRPFKHRVIKNWVLGVVITVTWVTGGLISAVMALLRPTTPTYYFFYLWCSFISICLFITFVSYTSIVVKVYCGAHPQHHGTARRERTLTKTLFIVTVVSLMTWLPYAVYFFLVLNTGQRNFHPFLVRSLSFLFYTNSLVNPILYAIRMPEFRRALVLLVRRQQRQVQVEIPLRVIPGN